jgi:hypothetical protein
MSILLLPGSSPLSMAAPSQLLYNSESGLLYDWRCTANQFLVTSLLKLTTSNFFRLNTCVYSHYVTPSLMRGWVSRLQLLLALASAVILGSESRGTHDHVLLAQIRDSPNLEDQVPYLYPPGTGFPFRRFLRLAGLRWRYSNFSLGVNYFYSLMWDVRHPVMT